MKNTALSTDSSTYSQGAAPPVIGDNTARTTSPQATSTVCPSAYAAPAGRAKWTNLVGAMINNPTEPQLVAAGSLFVHTPFIKDRRIDEGRYALTPLAGLNAVGEGGICSLRKRQTISRSSSQPDCPTGATLPVTRSSKLARGDGSSTLMEGGTPSAER